MMFCNIQGLYPRSNKHKVQLLKESAIIENVFLIAITESHLRDEILDAEIVLDGFHLYRSDRANEIRKGGVIVYVREDFAPGSQIVSFGSNGIVEYVSLYIPKINAIVITIYRPPTCEAQYFESTIQKIDLDIESLGTPLPTVIMCGDFNFPNIEWRNNIGDIRSSTFDMRQQAGILLEFMEKYCLVQYVTEPTRLNNILDLFMSNNEDLIRDIDIIDTSISDHRLVLVRTCIRGCEAEDARCLPRRGFAALNFNHSSIQWELILNEMMDVDWSSMCDHESPEDILARIKLVSLEICSKYIPLRRQQMKNRRLIPRDRRVLMRKRTKINDRLKFCIDPAENSRLFTRLRNIEDSLRVSHEKECKLSETRAIEMIKQDPRYFYSYAKSKACIKVNVGPLKIHDQIFDKPEAVGKILADQYSSAFSVPVYSFDQNNVDLICGEELPENFITIELSENDIVDSIGKLSTGAATGPDGAPPKLLKECAAALKYPIRLLWQKSLLCGRIPEELKMGVITPVHKGGSRSEPKNYRPITLTSHLIKIFERVITERLVEFMRTRDLFNARQHGFRTKRSCLSQLIEHYHDILDVIAGGNTADVIHLDFAKAFDKVDHGVLLRKLRALGVSGTILKWIGAFLSNRKQAVFVDGTVSDESDVISGVPQGTVLGPILFLVFIGDIDHGVQHANVNSFADDTRMMMNIKEPTDILRLQEDLDKIYEWADTNNMLFNADKFEVLRYGPGNVGDPRYLSPEGIEIDLQCDVRDLGIVMSNSGKFDEQISNVVRAGRRKVGWLLRTFATRERAPMLVLYKALILPSLEYCCQVWSPHKIGRIRDLESVQRFFTQKIRGVENLDYWARLSSLKIYSLQRRRERYCIIYVWKIVNDLAMNIINEIYMIRTRDSVRGGLFCLIPPVNHRAPYYVQTLIENSFAVRGPRLFNAIPRELRDFRGSLLTFKRKLDKFLVGLPDKPSLPQYYQSAAGNGLIDQLMQLRADQ